MNRKLTIPVSSDTYDLIQQLAYEQGHSLAAFCRDRIMAKENVENELRALQSTLAETIHEAVQSRTKAVHSGNGSTDIQAMIAEVLLLLRTMVPPQTLRTVQSELKRIGLEPFTTG